MIGQYDKLIAKVVPSIQWSGHEQNEDGYQEYQEYQDEFSNDIW